jgi:hypothetical protein
MLRRRSSGDRRVNGITADVAAERSIDVETGSGDVRIDRA